MSEISNEGWECEDCKEIFSIGNGFIGSIDDFEFQIREEDKKKIEEEQSQFECSPFMSFVVLCNSCLSKRKAK